MLDELKSALGFGGVLHPEEIQQIVAAFKPRILKAGDHFIRQNKPSNELAFITEGVMRIYITHDDVQEATKYFMRINQFSMDIRSFYDHSLADASVQAVVETKLLVTNRLECQRLSEAIPKLYMLTKSLTEVTLLNKIKDNDYLHFGTAKQKYEEFLRRYPDLAKVVPLQYIATYLQIAPQSLSRLRKNY